MRHDWWSCIGTILKVCRNSDHFQHHHGLCKAGEPWWTYGGSKLYITDIAVYWPTRNRALPSVILEKHSKQHILSSLKRLSPLRSVPGRSQTPSLSPCTGSRSRQSGIWRPRQMWFVTIHRYRVLRWEESIERASLSPDSTQILPFEIGALSCSDSWQSWMPLLVFS